MFRQPIGRHWYLVIAALGIVALLGGYSAYSWHRQSADPKDIAAPNFHQILHDGLIDSLTPDETRKGEVRFWEDMKATYYRLLVGLIWTVLVSLLVGVLMGCYAPVEAFFMPSLAFCSKIPGTALVVLFSLVVGLTFKLYTVLIFFGIFPTLAQLYFHAAKEDVPEELLFKARTLGASQFGCIWNVILPHIAPKILEGIRLSVGPALVYLIATEYLWGENRHGVGTTLRTAELKGISVAPLVYCYVITLGTVGLIIDSTMRWLRRKLFPWYG
jgi:NitT/TauT family transport system permease protein